MPPNEGFHFGAPDTEANTHLGRIVHPEADPPPAWGALVTPHEVRFDWLMGNSRLVTQDGTYYTDQNIKGIIDRYTLALARTLRWDIYPVLHRHRPPKPEEPREIEEHASWEDAYPYHNGRGSPDFFRVELRHRPLVRLLKWELRSPFDDRRVLDLYPGADINYEQGILRNTRAIGHSIGAGAGALPLRGPRYYQHGFGNRALPNSHYIDYISGYDSASRVPADLVEVISRMVAIHIMSGYGDGLVAGLAGFSISLGSISESAQTAMSATSGLMGARIGEFVAWLKDWYARNAHHYRRPGLSLL